jgi:hypothetical protein
MDFTEVIGFWFKTLDRKIGSAKTLGLTRASRGAASWRCWRQTDWPSISSALVARQSVP